jgi:hypothetical protein
VKPRPAGPDELAALASVLAEMHGAQGAHRRSVHVRETFQGQVVWEGDVEVFDLAGHALASRAYAWSYETDSGGRRYVAVLHMPPVTSPQKAVKAAIVQEARARGGR